MGTRLKVANGGATTSTFGSPGRISHDSSKFYNSRLYEGLANDENIDYVENPIPAQFLNSNFCHICENKYELPDCSVHLMITSPPYNVIKEYDDDLNLPEYLNLLNSIYIFRIKE